MKYHFWQFLVNQEGQPLQGAYVSIYLAGGNTPAYIYTSESAVTAKNTTPQITTNEVGYFEFWIGDNDETYGYDYTQKIKLSWEREGIASGVIDNIDIFWPNIKSVDTTSYSSQVKSKMVSDFLAYWWTNHVYTYTMSSSSDWIDNGDGTGYIGVSHTLDDDYPGITLWSVSSSGSSDEYILPIDNTSTTVTISASPSGGTHSGFLKVSTDDLSQKLKIKLVGDSNHS